MAELTGGSPGPSTDRHNDPVVDPTENVKALNKAEAKRQDDLREMSVAHIETIAKLRDEHARELTSLRSAAIERELALIESRRVEQKIDTKVAVDAALSAAEKAVKEQTTASEKSILKSENSAAEQSRQQNATFTAALKGVTDLLADVKDRVVKVESRKDGVRESESDQRNSHAQSNAGLMVAIGFLGLILTAAIVAVALYAALHK